MRRRTVIEITVAVVYQSSYLASIVEVDDADEMHATHIQSGNCSGNPLPLKDRYWPQGGPVANLNDLVVNWLK